MSLLADNRSTEKALEEIRSSLNKQAEQEDSLAEQGVKDAEVDRALRKQYARWIIIVLITELVFLNVIFMLVGLDWLKYSHTTFQIFVGGVLVQTFGVFAVVTKYLFSRKQVR